MNRLLLYHKQLAINTLINNTTMKAPQCNGSKLEEGVFFFKLSSISCYYIDEETNGETDKCQVRMTDRKAILNCSNPNSIFVIYGLAM